MSKDRQYWHKFWAEKDNPLHSSDDGAYYDKLAAELCLLLPPGTQSLLDIGCGSGALYQRMGLDKLNYVGIDLSQAMVSKFKNDHPRADVRLCDVRDFDATQKFDVIFSHGVVQNLNPGEFKAMLATTKKLLTPSGRIIHAGMLWDRGRWLVESGVLQNNPLPSYKRAANALLTRSKIKMGMGHWYSMRKVRQLAKQQGLDSQFFGSILYPYRFHVALTKHAPHD
jgi:cyclopropane fatty-acyl-phospholipid synthase-like methyltransferase